MKKSVLVLVLVLVFLPARGERGLARLHARAHCPAGGPGSPADAGAATKAHPTSEGCVFSLHELRSISMLMSPFEELSGHHGELGHYAPSSSDPTLRPYGNLFLEFLLRTCLPVSVGLSGHCFLSFTSLVLAKAPHLKQRGRPQRVPVGYRMAMKESCVQLISGGLRLRAPRRGPDRAGPVGAIGP